MKTDELIGILATGARPVAPHRLEQRFGGAALLGLLGAGVLMLLGYGVRPDLAQALQLPMWWLKFSFAAALAGLGAAAAAGAVDDGAGCAAGRCTR